MLTENLKIVKDAISRSVEKSSRDIDDIRLIAVSKTNPLSMILEGVNAGLIDFGENKAIEFRDKSELVKKNLIWHFIGHLQTNKVKYVIKNADYIHSVDSIKLAAEIDKRASQINKIQNVLFEVNTSDEDAKFGLRSYDELSELVSKCEELPNLNPVGLMTMASFTQNEDALRGSFKKLKEMYNKINSKYNSIVELSMGMTNDFTIAIEEGATMVRVGTAIFGKRDLSLSWSEK